MKRRKWIGIRLIIVLLLLSGTSWTAYRVVRQEQLNRQLITAIKRTRLNRQYRDRAEEVRGCLQRGADPNARDAPSPPTLSWNGLLALLGLKRTNINATQPALLLALEGEITGVSDPHDISGPVNPDVVQALVQYGAEVNVKDRYGRTPLVAAFNPTPNAFLHRGNFFDVPNWECELILIKAGADVEACDENGYTALMMGGICAALLQKGAKVDAAMQNGATALLCRTGNAEDCQVLLINGANVNASENGWTALMEVAQNGDEAMVSLFLQYRANVNANVGQGRTALMAAASEGHSAIMQTLLQHGAIVDAQDENGWTALTWAAQDGNKACVQLLLDRGASVTTKTKTGATLAQIIKGSDEAHHPAILRLLKAHGMKD